MRIYIEKPVAAATPAPGPESSKEIQALVEQYDAIQKVYNFAADPQKNAEQDRLAHDISARLATLRSRPPEPSTARAAGTGAGLWLGPSISFDLFVIDLDTREYQYGLVPGAGYGLKWKPGWYNATSVLLAADLFVQATFVDEGGGHDGLDFFAIQTLPVVTIIDWIGVGFGPRFMVGLDKAIKDRTDWVFSFGVKTST